jgi:hypothetical protein
MEKPFDIKELVKDLEQAGLPIAEQAAELIVAKTFDWVEKSAAIHPNAIVKAAVPLALQVVKPVVAEALNKIDGNPAN